MGSELDKWTKADPPGTGAKPPGTKANPGVVGQLAPPDR